MGLVVARCLAAVDSPPNRGVQENSQRNVLLKSAVARQQACSHRNRRGATAPAALWSERNQIGFTGFGHWFTAMDEVAAETKRPWRGGTGDEQVGCLLDGGGMAVDGAAGRTCVLDGDMSRHRGRDRSDGLDDQGMGGATTSAKQLRRRRNIGFPGKNRGVRSCHEDAPK